MISAGEIVYNFLGGYMEYWLPVTGRNDYVYSCDMLRYKLEFKVGKYAKTDLVRMLTAYGRFDVKQYPDNFADFKYRNMFTIDYDTSSMTVGIGFNGCKNEDFSIGFLEVNPNKCFDSLQCMADIQTIFDACWEYELLRFDLAIDLPFPRENVSVVKDGRKYALDMRSISNKTEYLGVRNSSGYIKLYNKSTEQGLEEEDITRLEMTCAGNWTADQIVAKLPYVFVANGSSGNDDLRHLSSTQRVLVRALRSHPDRDELYKSLNADMRVKLRPYLYDADTTLTYDTDAVCAVLANIRQFEKMMDDRAYLCVSREELQEDAARRTAKRRGSDFVHLTDAEARNNPFDNEPKMV